MTFTKLFSSITESSVWVADDQTRLVWITMLAMADKHGRVWASIPGLANRARVSVEAVSKAIDIFLSPDEYSRTKTSEGRRIEPIDGGWRLINHKKYREIRDEEARREQNAESQRRFREKNNSKPENKPRVSQDKPTGKPIAEAEAEAEAEKYHKDSRTVLHLLNEASKKHFRETDCNLTFISARLSEPGVTLDGVRRMITRQCRLWLNTAQAEYLRPETIFNKTKFDSYYAAKDAPIVKQGQQPVFDPNSSDASAARMMEKLKLDKERIDRL